MGNADKWLKPDGDTSYTSLQVGDKVVCIDAGSSETTYLTELHEGHVYTIRWVGPDPYPLGRSLSNRYPSGVLCVRLVEIPERFNAPLVSRREWPDCPFAAARFRPMKRQIAKAEQKKEVVA